MEYKEILASAIHSLRTNVLRTALTMLGIIIGVSAVILISSIGQSAVKFVTNEISQFGTNFFSVSPGSNPFAGFVGGSGVPLTLDDVDAIRDADIPNLDVIAPVAFANRSVTFDEEKETVFVYGFTPELDDILGFEVLYGETLSDTDANSRVVVLGSDISDELFGEDIDPVGESIRVDDIKFKVIGVIHAEGALSGSQFNGSVTVPLEVLQDDITGSDALTEIDISVIDINHLDEAIENVEEVLRDYRDIPEDEEADFNIQNIEETLSLIETVTGILTALIAGISAISLIVGGVGVMNIMLVSVTERTKEIGLLKAIGAKEKDILLQFLIESAVMTLAGGLVGIAIGVSLSMLVSTVAGLPIVVSIFWILVTVIVSTLVGVVFGLYPARRAARLSPIDALRYE